jgi:hypothetical protein
MKSISSGAVKLGQQTSASPSLSKSKMSGAGTALGQTNPSQLSVKQTSQTSPRKDNKYDFVVSKDVSDN